MLITHNVITFHSVAYHSTFVTDGNVTSKQDNFLLPRDAYATRIARIVYMLWPHVRLSVCLSQASLLSKQLNGFIQHRVLDPPLNLHCVRYLQISILPSETLSQTPKLADFPHFRFFYCFAT